MPDLLTLGIMAILVVAVVKLWDSLMNKGGGRDR